MNKIREYISKFFFNRKINKTSKPLKIEDIKSVLIIIDSKKGTHLNWQTVFCSAKITTVGIQEKNTELKANIVLTDKEINWYGCLKNNKINQLKTDYDVVIDENLIPNMTIDFLIKSIKSSFKISRLNREFINLLIQTNKEQEFLSETLKYLQTIK